MAKLGMHYNTGLVSVENEGPGFASVGWLQSLDYSTSTNTCHRFCFRVVRGKYGWTSNYRTKDLAVGWLLRYIIEHGVTIHDRKTYEEMDDYVTLEGGGYGNATVRSTTTP